MKPDVQDDHYYVRAKQSFKEAAHYDKADRNGPKIFIGEWATREGAPTPNFNSALGDAAWMTGMASSRDLRRVPALKRGRLSKADVADSPSQWLPLLPQIPCSQP